MQTALVLNGLHMPGLGRSVLTNATLDSVITGWSAVNTPTTFEWSAFRAHVIGDANGDGMGQAVVLTLNKRYRLKFDYQIVSGGLNVTKVGMTTISGLTGTGTRIHDFTETDGTSRTLLFQCNAAGEFYLDNIELREIL